MQRPVSRLDRFLPWVAFAHDIVMAAIAFILAFYLRVGGEALTIYRAPLIAGLPIFVISAAISFRLLGLYRGLWRYASGRDLTSILKAVGLALLIFMPLMFLRNRLELFPREAVLILGFILLVLLAVPRLLYRTIKDSATGRGADSPRRTPVLLVGAGDGADLFIRSMAGNQTHPYRVVGVLDDRNRNLTGRRIRDVTILGHVDDLPAVIEKLARQGDRPQRLIVTRPSAELDGAAMRRLVDLAQPFGFTIARMPALTEFRDAAADGRLKLQPVAVEDLLGRPQVVHDGEALRAMVSGRRVLVTGAGGTIGGELTRQLAALAPARLALVEHGEFALYNIGQAMEADYPGLNIATHLADIRDRPRIFSLFRDESPDIIFHAAALKHLPLAEINPSECVLTNAIGTRNVADAARAAGAKGMVMISTDKAVHPTSIMGLTKRIAETYCQAIDLESENGTRFVTVRFGNVLGSTGSVVPLFQRQLAAGGPLTVTDPNVERYFMTCAEAVQLVLQAAAHSVAGPGKIEAPGERGRIFVLDMGEPVKIVDLARQMIRLAGLEPDRDIEIKFTGLRPGEKLSERLSDDDEPLRATSLPGTLYVAPRIVPRPVIDAFLDRLAACAQGGSASPELMELLEQARLNTLPDAGIAARPAGDPRKRLRPV
jgi:O-antigen biosynthesis protein WbqV